MILSLTNNPEETFNISILNIVYSFRQLWNENGFWTLDISDSDENILVYGVKIVAGAFLLEQYPDIPFDLKNDTEIDPSRNNLNEFIIEVFNKDAN